MPTTAIIVDDEPLARQELQFLLESHSDIEILAQASNGIEAVDLIRTYHPDVVFLDVRMPGLDGFAVLKKLMADRRQRPPQIVFATAFDQYAVKAFEVNAVDYLLKPFDSKRLANTLAKLHARLIGTNDDAASQKSGATLSGRVAGAEAKLDALLRMVEEQAALTSGSPSAAAQAAGGRPGRVVLRAEGRLLLVDQKDVCFATTEAGRITVTTKLLDGEANVRTLDELFDQLDPEIFWRAHRSYIVNLQHIREVVPWFKSSYQLRMDDRHRTEIPVSRTQTKRLRELFNL